LLLEQTLTRNSPLVQAAFELHQRGAIPAATHLIDLDAVAENARAMATAARAHNLRVYLMSKQNGHNPHMAAVALAQGLDSIVVVEAFAAHMTHRYGQPVGHVGHLANVPRGQVRQIAAMEPELVTVYSYEMAAWFSAAAAELGRVQDILIRVTNPEDGGPVRGMVGGWTEAECVAAARRLLELPNVRLAGLTQHSCINYATERDPARARPTDGFFTMLRAKEAIERELGLEGLRISCAGNLNSLTFAVLASYGATDVEPGRALTGAAYFHALDEMPERPAQLFVTEVSHRWQEQLYVYGGGFAWLETFGGGFDGPYRGLVGATLAEAADAPVELLFRGAVDYHGVCTDVGHARIGDAAVFALHPQAFVERGYVAAVSGVSRGTPRVEAIFDSACHPLDETLAPLPLEEAIDSVARVGRAYASTKEPS
jgi:predicted amino acid racemase